MALCTANASMLPTGDAKPSDQSTLLNAMDHWAKLQIYINQLQSAPQVQTYSPEMIENIKKMYAQVCQYSLWGAEQVATATSPLLLEELLETVPLVPPTSVAKSPPSPCAKDASASAYLLGDTDTDQDRRC
eukprot:2771297-Ditylum_brightwellii.AAC.1